MGEGEKRKSGSLTPVRGKRDRARDDKWGRSGAEAKKGGDVKSPLQRRLRVEGEKRDSSRRIRGMEKRSSHAQADPFAPSRGRQERTGRKRLARSVRNEGMWSGGGGRKLETRRQK